MKRFDAADGQDAERQFEASFFLKSDENFFMLLSVFLCKYLTLDINIRTGGSELVEQNPPSKCNFSPGLLRSWRDEVSSLRNDAEWVFGNSIARYGAWTLSIDYSKLVSIFHTYVTAF